MTAIYLTQPRSTGTAYGAKRQGNWPPDTGLRRLDNPRSKLVTATIWRG